MELNPEARQVARTQLEAALVAQRRAKIRAARDAARRMSTAPIPRAATPTSRRTADFETLTRRAGLADEAAASAARRLRLARVGAEVKADGVTFTRTASGVSIRYSRSRAPQRVVTLAGIDAAAVFSPDKKRRPGS